MEDKYSWETLDWTVLPHTVTSRDEREEEPCKTSAGDTPRADLGLDLAKPLETGGRGS